VDVVDRTLEHGARQAAAVGVTAARLCRALAADDKGELLVTATMMLGFLVGILHEHGFTKEAICESVRGVEMGDVS
jgi:hypothetical protein